jgi:hypothetical protein
MDYANVILRNVDTIWGRRANNIMTVHVSRKKREKFDSNKSPTKCNNIPVYYPDVCLQLNMFREFSRPSLEAQ